MISLVPSWAVNYDQFWNSVNRRNLWFIKLRYAAVLMLIGFLLAAEFILDINLSSIQFNAVLVITLLILSYNFIVHFCLAKIQPVSEGFNNLHLSLLQMLLDLTALTLLIYFLGSLENPMYMFYIFHMIIGSLILPGSIIYTIALSVIVIFSCMIILEYYGILFHHSIYGFLTNPIYLDTEFIVIFLFVFIIMMLMSVVLANKIAKELYKREQDLFETLKKLDEVEKTKQKYIMAVVHEIKTPIAAVKSYIELILNNYIVPIDKEVSERLDRANVRADEAINLANEVLQISKIKLSKNINKEEIDIMTLMNEILCRYKANSEVKKIKLEINDQRIYNRKLLGDKDLLDLAFSNLIGNAIKYSLYDGCILIGVSEDDTGNLIVEISDDGIGIPQDEIHKVFQEFYRASNTKHKGLEGTGMGLSIVKYVIQNHNGSIKVESPSRLQKESRPGTCFIISLPSND